MIEEPTRTAALLRLCQLVSPALPIGSYNFSQGLEYAVQAGWVNDERSALEWIGGLARHAIGTLDVPVLIRMHRAWTLSDIDKVIAWSQLVIAARETRELRAEDQHLGRALAKVLADLDVITARQWISAQDTSFITMFALASVHWGIGEHHCACGFLWSWAENQVLGAVKSVPLGQSAGQRMLDVLIREIPQIATRAAGLTEPEIGSAAPLQLIASAAHETQYTRLFRS